MIFKYSPLLLRVVACLFGGLFPVLLPANPLPEQGIQDLANFEILADSSGEQSWDRLRQASLAASFQEGVAGQRPDREVGAYWLRFALVNPDDFAREVVLEFDRWALVQLYFEGLDAPRQTGQSIPYGLRDYPFNNSFLIRLKLAPLEHRTCWVRLSQQGFEGLAPHYFSVKYGSVDAANAQQYLLAGINLVIITILLFILTYNLFFFVSTREKRYRFYLITVFLVVLETIRTAGFYGPVLGSWEYLPQFERHSLGLQNLLLGVFLLFMVRDLLDIKLHFPKLDRIWRLQLIPIVLVYIVFLFEFELALLLVLSMVIWGMLINAYVIFKSLQIKHPMAIYYGIATLAAGVSTVIHAMLHADLLYLGEVAEILSRSSGTAISDIILSYALGRQVFNLKIANSEKQAEIIRNLRAQRQLRSQMSREILASQENVRRLVAHQLHDEVQNLLVSIRYTLMGIQAKVANAPNMNAQTERALGLSMTLLKDTIQKVRHISTDLMPNSLSDPMGLDLTLQNLLNRVPAHLRIAYEYEAPEALPFGVRTLAYRIAQEALTNTLKHAQAEDFSLRIAHANGVLKLHAADNGIGAAPEEFHQSNGLEAIRQYLTLLEGSFELQSVAGQGTSIWVDLPYAGAPIGEADGGSALPDGHSI